MAYSSTDNDLHTDATVINTKKAEEIIKKPNLSKTEYLYGTNNIEDFPEEIINYRTKILNEHLSKLLLVHYSDRDNVRVNKVLKAIKFWNDLKHK